MDANQAEAVNPKDIAYFLNSDLGGRMFRAKQNNLLFREKPFSLGVSRKDISEGLLLSNKDGESEDRSALNDMSDDFVLVQGIIDAFFIEDDEIVIVDYKTDYVTDEQMLIKRYQAQLAYYAKALSQISGRKIKESLIYSSRLRKTISISTSY